MPSNIVIKQKDMTAYLENLDLIEIGLKHTGRGKWYERLKPLQKSRANVEIILASHISRRLD